MKKRMINNIKKIGLVSLTGFMGLVQTGCSDFLEIEPLNEIILEKFWSEKSDVQAVIAGCYSGLQSEGVVKRMMVWGEFRSDNIGIGRNIDSDTQLEKVLKENIDAKNSYTTWDGFYNIINRCNTVIKYAPKVAASDPSYTENDLNANLAEMTALRALCYFYLIRAFRDVPYSTEAFTDDNQMMALPATKFNDVLDKLIESLESVKDKAVARYPITTPLYQTGRITQEAIYAMLCEMYLWKKDYDNCIKYADLVIASKKKYAKDNEYKLDNMSASTLTNRMERYNGFPLISGMQTTNVYGNTYSTLFGSDSESRVEEYNQEIIFQLVYNDNPNTSSMIANKAVNAFYGNDNSNIGLVAPSTVIMTEVSEGETHNYFAERNKKLDARMYENCNISTSSIHKFTTRSIQINVTTPTSPKITYSSLYADGQNGSNWVIYRLTDIMLLKAEALTQKLREGADQETVDYNKPILDEAFTLVNAVNKRSLCQSQLADTLLRSSYNTKSLMETLVLQERQRELMFEGKRWFDLVRVSERDGNTDKLLSAVRAAVEGDATMIALKLQKMDAIYWPYNYEELKVNTNLKQNPAFSSGENESYAKNL